MDAIDERSLALIASPAGCAFLSLVERVGTSPAEAADPLTSFFLVGRALSDVTVWRGDRAESVQKLLLDGARLRPLAHSILSQPDAAWWFAPLDRAAQLLARIPGTAEMPMPPVVPKGQPTERERYAQKPEWGLYSSTGFDGISSYLVGESECFEDLGTLTFPCARYRLSAAADARVFEIDGPADWDRLCRNYPALEQGGLQGGLLVPDFAAVARDWDAVHVTLGGLLVSAQVAVPGAEGKTALQGWDAEQTVWLNPAFDGMARLPDLAERIRAPSGLR